MMLRSVFVTGATGYMGSALVAALLARGHRVQALAQRKAHTASRLARRRYWETPWIRRPLQVPSRPTPWCTIGTPHPTPAKAASFQAVDLASVDAALDAARRAGIRHLVYVSVAHPAPLMQAYIAARQAAEDRIRSSGISASILRPWYVLGPGHRWPVLLVPCYAILERLPATREAALRLGLVTREQMLRALVACVEQGPSGIRVLDVAAIRSARES